MRIEKWTKWARKQEFRKAFTRSFSVIRREGKKTMSRMPAEVFAELRRMPGNNVGASS